MCSCASLAVMPLGCRRVATTRKWPALLRRVPLSSAARPEGFRPDACRGWFKDFVTKRKVKRFHKRKVEKYRLWDMAALFPARLAQNRVHCE